MTDDIIYDRLQQVACRLHIQLTKEWHLASSVLEYAKLEWGQQGKTLRERGTRAVHATVMLNLAEHGMADDMCTVVRVSRLHLLCKMSSTEAFDQSVVICYPSAICQGIA